MRLGSSPFILDIHSRDDIPTRTGSLHSSTFCGKDREKHRSCNRLGRCVAVAVRKGIAVYVTPPVFKPYRQHPYMLVLTPFLTFWGSLSPFGRTCVLQNKAADVQVSMVQVVGCICRPRRRIGSMHTHTRRICHVRSTWSRVRACWYAWLTAKRQELHLAKSKPFFRLCTTGAGRNLATVCSVRRICREDQRVSCCWTFGWQAEHVDLTKKGSRISSSRKSLWLILALAWASGPGVWWSG